MLIYCFDAYELECAVNEVIDELPSGYYLDTIYEGDTEVFSWDETANTVTYVDGETVPFVNAFFQLIIVTND